MYTDSLLVISQYVHQKLYDAREALGLEEVLYGDQELVGKVPTVCIWGDDKERVLEGAMLRSVNQFTCIVMIYHGPYQDSQETEKECLLFAENIEAFLHTDRICDQGPQGSLVYHSICQRVEPGQIVRSGTLMRATRITWQAFSKTGVTA